MQLLFASLEPAHLLVRRLRLFCVAQFPLVLAVPWTPAGICRSIVLRHGGLPTGRGTLRKLIAPRTRAGIWRGIVLRHGGLPTGHRRLRKLIVPRAPARIWRGIGPIVHRHGVLPTGHRRLRKLVVPRTPVGICICRGIVLRHGGLPTGCGRLRNKKIVQLAKGIRTHRCLDVTCRRCPVCNSTKGIRAVMRFWGIKTSSSNY